MKKQGNTIPPQPDESLWTFVADLQKPLHADILWRRKAPLGNEADLSAGVRMDARFPDPDGVLETACHDFHNFLGKAGIAVGGNMPDRNDRYEIVTGPTKTGIFDEYRIRISKERAEVLAGDTEGIRRGLIYLEDEILRSGGPFLPIGEIHLKPVIRTRISRCFYGPINRPPKCKDELTDDVDYYPDEYLNRLAHDGVNVLWLTIHFFQTVPSEIIPEYGRNAAPRLEKLRRTVKKCARYGIRIYPFCIEPAGFSWPHPEVAAAAAAHPELKGHKNSFCTSTEKGRAYLE